MKRVASLVFGLFLLLGLCAGASATIYTGSISGVNGDSTLFGTDGWNTAMLSWTVDDATNVGLWTYAYTFQVDRKGISHVIIEVSDNFTEDNIFGGTTFGWELNTYNGQGQSNPGIPSSVFGLKWDLPEYDESGNEIEFFEYSWLIVSDRSPMWGNFYSKDGKDGTPPNQIDVYAYNSGFAESLIEPYAVGDGNNGGWVLVPNTATAVPEPATMLLLGFGLIGLAVAGRRNLRK